MQSTAFVRIVAVGLLASVADACARGDTTAPNVVSPAAPAATRSAMSIDQQLQQVLSRHRFTGRVGSTLEMRLGRPIDRTLADLGRLLWFDPITGLNDDNSCGGCHSPTNGFGDTQSIAIGIDNNGIVGPHRMGPRNQRRTPMAINSAFFPTLMWNSRFSSRSGDPFDNSRGFRFPPPEGSSLSGNAHLLQAQAFIPPTERVEAAGFAFHGGSDQIRAEVIRRLSVTPSYRALFAAAIPAVAAGDPIQYTHFAAAIAEFEFTMVFADAPIDRYARGNPQALSPLQKQGALLFFGRAGCVQCHAVSGNSNEMFSDFRQHVIGVPQIAPSVSNMVFDGPGANEDFGLEQVSGKKSDRYMFRSSPLRNVALQQSFMHNGAFTVLEDAIRHHLDPVASARAFTTDHLAPDLRGPMGPIDPVLRRLDPLLRRPIVLDSEEFRALADFVRNGLLDPGAAPSRLRPLIPPTLPSGRTGFTFEFQ